MKRFLKSRIFTFILGAVIFSCITLVSAYSLFANNVGFNPTDNTWKNDDDNDITNVQDALDDLYLRHNGYVESDLKNILKISSNKVSAADVLTTTFMNKISSNKAAAKMIMDTTPFRNSVSVSLLNALNVALVNPLPSNNTNVIASTTYSNDWTGYMAFRESGNSWCNVNGKVTNQYIGYNFNKNVDVRIVKFLNGGPQSYQAKTVRLQASADNNTWVDASDNYTLANSNTTVFIYNTKLDEAYKYWRVFIVNIYSSSYVEIGGLQFYGV